MSSAAEYLFNNQLNNYVIILGTKASSYYNLFHNNKISNNMSFK